jgi:C1A family cysteine protease
VWVDRQNIVGGEPWRAAIIRAIAECDALVVVLSPHSVTSENVVKELSIAESRNRHIVPIVYRGCDVTPDMEYQLADLQRIDFSKMAFEDGLNRLVTALQTSRGTSMLDYSSEMSPVRDQGREASVTGFALAYALEFQIWRSRHKHITLSPRYIYYEARRMAGYDLSLDCGAQLRDGLAVLKCKGAVAEAVWPYTPGEFNRKPPKAVSSAARFKIKNYEPRLSVDEVKATLTNTGPVVAGVNWFRGFLQDEKVRRTGQLYTPGDHERLAGGGALCLVGYDDKAFKFINSWGPFWGDHGYGYIRFAYFERLVFEVWAIKT